jgi:hypothetical protein
MPQHDKNDLIEFAEDHIKQFNAIPCEFETRSGKTINFGAIWNICRRYGLLDKLKANDL